MPTYSQALSLYLSGLDYKQLSFLIKGGHHQDLAAKLQLEAIQELIGD